MDRISFSDMNDFKKNGIVSHRDREYDTVETFKDTKENIPELNVKDFFENYGKEAH